LVIFGRRAFVTVVTFGTPVAFWYTKDQCLVHWTSFLVRFGLWYIWFTSAHFTFGTPVGTLCVGSRFFGTPSSFLVH